MPATRADILVDRPLRAAATTPKHAGFRRDIQGLRAVAVAAVILDHLIAWPAGGFVGVDVFFVLSGFLITGLLLREHDRTGRISIADFYRRRARRILPVSYLVLGVTLFTAAILFAAPRFFTTLGDAIAAVLFSVNWHLAIVGTDYMNAAGPVSPLQHYWSLAVEEQFYVVWPIVLIAVFAITGAVARRRGARSGRVTRRWAFVVLGALSVASLGWAFYESVSSPTFAYFSTFSRAWELGLGALVALVAAKLTRLSRTVRAVLAWSGIALIGVSLFVITSETVWPAPGALLPVVATALVLASGAGFEAPYVGILTNPVSRYIGDISYSLYLWHFPIIIFVGLFLPAGEVGSILTVLALTFVLSVFSYHFVENPVRESNWLEPRTRIRRAPKGAKKRMSKRMLAAGWMAALTVTAVVLVVTAVQTNGALRAADPQIVVPVAQAEGEEQLTATEQRTAEIAAALSTVDWPATDPSLDALDKNAGAAEWITDQCLNIYSNVRDSCIYGDPNAPKLAVLLGDSTAVSYLPGLLPVLEEQGYRTQVLTMYSCPAWNISVGSPGSENFRVCNEQHAWVYDYAKQLSPDLVLMSSLAGSVVKLSDGSEGDASVQAYGAAATATVTDLSATSGEILVLGPPPAADNPVTECKTAVNHPADCVHDVSTLFRAVAAAETAAAASVANARYIDVTPWLCNQGVCPAFIGTAPVSWDGVHLTDKASEALAPLWRETLFP